MDTVPVLLILCLVHVTYSRDFYMGMFKKNDFLMAADELYKPRSPSRITYAKYGRIFKCRITYFRVVDRLGSNSNPKVEILRGGLQMKYIVVLLSVYNQPISVNIYVGCQNKNTTRPPPKAKKAHEETTVAGTDAGGDKATTVVGGEAPTTGGATEAGDVKDAETVAAEEPANEEK